MVPSLMSTVKGRDVLKVSVLNDRATILNQDGVSVTSTDPVLIVGTNLNRVSLLIQNLGTAAIFIGNEDVTTTTGIKINEGESLSDLIVNADLYGITASGTADVRYLEEIL